MTALLQKAGDARQWWGMIAAFLIDSYHTRPMVLWTTQAGSWGTSYRKGSRTIAHVVPYDGYLLVLVPFTAGAIKRAATNPELLDATAHQALDDYLSGKTTMPRLLVVSDGEADAVMRLVSVAHPRKGHPCGSL